MSDTHVIGDEGTVGETANEHPALVDEVAERERRLRPSVELDVQVRIDHADDRTHDGRLFGQILEAEERQLAREWEIERTRVRWDRGQDSDREARCRNDVVRRHQRTRREFAVRAGSVDRWAHPEEPDAREQLAPEELGQVNREAERVSEHLGGWSRAAVSRLIAERTVESGDVTEAVLRTVDRLQIDPGSVVPIGRLGEVAYREVSVEGVVCTLWEPSHPAIAQVGLLEDASGRTKLTSWRKSGQRRFVEGDRIRIRDAAKSWYDGRCSIALTGRSQVTFLEE